MQFFKGSHSFGANDEINNCIVKATGANFGLNNLSNMLASATNYAINGANWNAQKMASYIANQMAPYNE